MVSPRCCTLVEGAVGAVVVVGAGWQSRPSHYCLCSSAVVEGAAVVGGWTPLPVELDSPSH